MYKRTASQSQGMVSLTFHVTANIKNKSADISVVMVHE